MVAGRSISGIEQNSTHGNTSRHRSRQGFLIRFSEHRLHRLHNHDNCGQEVDRRRRPTVDFNQIATQFYNAGLSYSAAIQPYALKLFFALFLIDVIVTWIQYTAEGQVDPSFFLGRVLKHVLSGGFVYLMIVNGFNWMYLVIQSFSRIGSALSGLPALSPQSVIQVGLNMANTLISSPTTSGVISSLELALVEAFCALVVAAAFLFVA